MGHERNAQVEESNFGCRQLVSLQVVDRCLSVVAGWSAEFRAESPVLVKHQTNRLGQILLSSFIFYRFYIEKSILYNLVVASISMKMEILVIDELELAGFSQLN